MVASSLVASLLGGEVTGYKNNFEADLIHAIGSVEVSILIPLFSKPG